MRDQQNREPTVYVVDDDEDVREGLKSIFNSVGLHAEAFSTTDEFLGCKLAEEPRCLVLDVRLPGLSGLDFQTELAKLNINIPIIFVSGHGDIPMTVKAMKAGAVEFLTKPIREQDLLDAVRVALDRDQARRFQNASDEDLRATLQRTYLTASNRSCGSCAPAS